MVLTINFDVAELHRRASHWFGTLVHQIGIDQWHLPTPCADWDVRALVNHVTGEALWTPPLMARQTIEDVGDRFDGDVLGADPTAAYDESAGAASEAFHAPGAMEAPCAVSYGPVPGEVYLGHRFVDVVVHGWDVAKATGQDTTLDPELVEACWTVIEPQKDLLLGSGAFGTNHEPEPGADRQTALLELLGRTP